MQCGASARTPSPGTPGGTAREKAENRLSPMVKELGALLRSHRQGNRTAGFDKRGGIVRTGWKDCWAAPSGRERVGREKGGQRGPTGCPCDSSCETEHENLSKGNKNGDEATSLRTLQCHNLRVTVYTKVACLLSAALRKALYKWKWKYRSGQWG